MPDFQKTGPEPGEAVPCTIGELLAYFVHLGATGFGGPIALAGYMQRDLVEQKRWISKRDYTEGMALAQLAPGPLAAQLAIYLGWVRAGVPGATLVGFAFILPSFFMVLGLSALYVHFGKMDWLQGAFYGIGAAVIAIIARSAYKLTKLTLGKDRLLWTLFGISAVTTAWTESEIIWLFILCGVAAVFIKAPPKWGRGPLLLAAPPAMDWLWSGLQGPGSGGILWKIGWYFAEAGAFIFGSGLAIVPFLYGGVVDKFHWLTERQFLDAVAVAMITPGPVVITVAFIGYLVSGPIGATVAAVGIFLPCYLFVILPAPYYRRFGGNLQIKAFVDGVSAAATGAIGGAAFVLGRRAVFDVPTALFCIAALAVLVKAKKVPEPLLIIAAGCAGLIVKGLWGG